MYQLNRFPIDPFDDFFKDIRSALGSKYIEKYNDNQKSFLPLVNISETDKNYSIDLSIPAIAKEDISVDVEKGILTIKGERKQANTVKEDKLHRNELIFGSFQRCFVLPENVKEGIKASYNNGMLHLALPKSTEDNNKITQITIE